MGLDYSDMNEVASIARSVLERDGLKNAWNCDIITQKFCDAIEMLGEAIREIEEGEK